MSKIKMLRAGSASTICMRSHPLQSLYNLCGIHCLCQMSCVAATSKEYALEQVDKARSWLHRAVKLARGDNGDFWALLYKLESQYGNAESQAQVRHPFTGRLSQLSSVIHKRNGFVGFTTLLSSCTSRQLPTENYMPCTSIPASRETGNAHKTA